MLNPQLFPLEVNPKTGEPFLRLRHHPNIILTPPRFEDSLALVSILNNSQVCDWLSGPPYPYTLDHATKFLATIIPPATQVLQQLEDAKDEEDVLIVGGCPTRYLREVKEDGTDVFIGDLCVMRCMHGELMGANEIDWENKLKREEENNSIPFGDPSIIWSMGNFLAASYHGQGIMSDAVSTVLNDWCIPRMGVRHMWVSTFTGNLGSVKVFLKNSFKLTKTIDNHAEVKGKTRGLNLLEWRHSS